ncbi:YjbF family lipoprotein [Yoonia sp. MH D7]
MGAFLAMICKNLIRGAVCIVALTSLATCGPLNEESPAAGLSQMVKARFTGGAEPVAAPAPALTREAADANPGAFMLMSLAGAPEQASLVTAGVNGTKVTWIGTDQISITLENGLLVATRGFAEDMMAADISQVMNALIDGGGTAVRRVEHLDGLDQISTQLLQCSIASVGIETVETLGKTSQVDRFDETCVSESVRFTNVYWINDAGVIVKSRQLVSRGVGYLELICP